MENMFTFTTPDAVRDCLYQDLNKESTVMFCGEKKPQKIKVAWNFWSFCLDNSQTSVVIKTATLYTKTTTAIKNTPQIVKK